MAGLRRGDPDAQGRLLALYGEPLVRFLVVVCQVDPIEAEDVAIETLYRAIEHIDSFVDKPGTGRHSFRNWLFTIARNLWRDRTRTQPMIFHLEDMERVPTPPVDLNNGPEAPDVKIVREALKSLPESQRLTLVLHYGGLRLTEVAEVLDARPGTVRQWKRRGINTLARRLKAHPALEHLLESANEIERELEHG
jgi:RNA polymerase sigma factor (sigma-70 family)